MVKLDNIERSRLMEILQQYPWFARLPRIGAMKAKTFIDQVEVLVRSGKGNAVP